MKGLQLRNLIRLRLQDVADQLPGTVGFVIPDRFHLVYLEFARAANALGLHETTGSRIAMASTAAGHAYTAALDTDVGDALIAEMEREIPESAKLLKPRIEGNRRHLREHGYVVACGLWSPHINGLAVPLWSPQYQTYVVATIGLLSVMFDEKRLHREVAPPMRELAAAIGGLARCPALSADDVSFEPHRAGRATGRCERRADIARCNAPDRTERQPAEVLGGPLPVRSLRAHQPLRIRPAAWLLDRWRPGRHFHQLRNR